ncbi:YciI family protein [Cupriavidus sp. NPDC089707]|uniref:YciI family protein n=1 Tax=Cupriavidus sp. NPDC089707 TaxID=3363963 RepID=UPI0037FA7D46
MPTHLEWLRQHQDEVIAAGSLREDPQEAPIGGLWIVRASDRAAVESLLRSDPFWTEGLRERFEIHSWHRAFDEAVTL